VVEGRALRALPIYVSVHLFMRRFECVFQVFAAAGAWINEAPIAETTPCFEVEVMTLALGVRSERPAYVRTFVPIDAQPAQVFIHGVDEFRPGTLLVKIFVAKNELSSGGECAPVSDPEGTRVPEVKVSGRRRSQPSTIRSARRGRLRHCSCSD
jgi:hypothetical protein